MHYNMYFGHQEDQRVTAVVNLLITRKSLRQNELNKVKQDIDNGCFREAMRVMMDEIC